MREALLFALLLATAGCGPVDSLRHALLRTPPHDRYAASLHALGLDSTRIGARWLDAGRVALNEAAPIQIPHRTTADVRSDSPSAFAYRVELRRGQVYVIAVEPNRPRLNVFIDLFMGASDGAARRVAGIGPPARGLAFEPDEDGTFIVRIQPELLASGQAAVVQTARAALLFPLPGVNRKSIQSFFGASRSAGRREHQGIDIFAPRGTPAVAAADGWISSTAPNELGGNVVWLWDPQRNQTLYYAHLDRHAVNRGDRVRKGEVVGFVGNTGNARTTAPHLHFGIYRRGEGAIDPLPYVVDPS